MNVVTVKCKCTRCGQSPDPAGHWRDRNICLRVISVGGGAAIDTCNGQYVWQDDPEAARAQACALMRRERDHEARMHGACLSIAEGAHGWERPIPHGGDSPATSAVRSLRIKLEETEEALAALRAERRESITNQLGRLRATLEAIPQNARVPMFEIETPAGQPQRYGPVPSPTLDDLCAHYCIGRGHGNRLSVYRQWPKIFPGGRKADGFLDDYDQPIDEAFIQNEYGGGEYLVKVVGPKSGTNQGYQHYESVRVCISGDAKYHQTPQQTPRTTP